MDRDFSFSVTNRMQLLEHTPAFDVDTAATIAAEHFGLHGRAHSLPSERDQNFLLTNQAGEKFVLKIANALESRTFLEAQNSIRSRSAGEALISARSRSPNEGPNRRQFLAKIRESKI